jgi:ABC-type bacteriocin/lantibiotic exporter with double-glycine peptidase domain
LNVIARQLNITLSPEQLDLQPGVSLSSLDEQGKQLGITFHSLTNHSLRQLPDTSHPVLLEDNTGNLSVLLKKRRKSIVLFNPLTNRQETLNLDAESTILRAWQCYPASYPVNASYLSLIQFTVRFFKQRLLKAAGFGILVATATLAVSLLSSFVLSHLLETHNNHPLILAISILLFCAGTALFSFANSLVVKAINADILFLLLPHIVEHILNLPMTVLNKFVSSDLSQRLSDYETAVGCLIKISLSVLFNGMGLVILWLYMAWCSQRLALLYLAIGILFSIIKLSLFQKSLRNLQDQLSAQGKLNAFLVESLFQIHKIRSANAENRIFDNWLQRLLKTKLFAELSIQIETLILVLDTLLPVSLLLCIYAILYFFPSSLSATELIQFMVCAGQFVMLFQKISLESVAFIQFLPGLKRMDPLLSESIEVDCSKAASIEFKQQISLSHIDYRHPESTKLILDDVSLDIPPGQFTALIGPSGAGKSTVFRLLLGLEHPQSGTITINSESVTGFNQKTIRKQFGVVLQTTSLFPGSIFSNIATNTTITLDAAWHLAELVGLAEEIQAMPMKMFTYIADNASESLSGGQKQKILIARALATDPKILLLDEATSALDSKSQALIHRNLRKLKITRFVIAHRYSTIIDADCIYVMEKGRIIDKGTYHELKQRRRLP